MSAEPSTPASGCLPYPGLRPFFVEEAHLYFGREKHRTELLKRLGATRFVSVVGTSGSGKSSLVQAGLLPDLLSGYLPGAGCDWVIVTSKPGNDPLGRLASALSGEGWTTDATALRTNSSALLDLAGQHLAKDQHLFVLIDQFEELFRLKVSENPVQDADEKAAFVRLLLTAGGQRADAPSHPRVHVLIAMRSEFLGRASVFRGLPEAIDQGQYLIPRLSREQLHRAIERPARVCSGEVDERLVQQLLNELGDDQDHLPVLQHALMRCWEFRDEQNRIDGKAYAKCGGLGGALSMDANGALHDVRCDLADRGALIVKRAFQALRETDVNGGQTRRPTTAADLCEMACCTPAELETAINPFRKRSFVLPPLPAPLEPSTLLDVSHEALLRGWDQLTKWIQEDDLERQRYLRIATRAADEAGSEHPDYLAPPVLPLLVKFWQDRDPPRAWALRHHPGYESAKAFLDASARHQAAVERQQAEQLAREAEAAARAAQQQEELDKEIAGRKRAKRLTWVTVTVASLVILVVVNAFWLASNQAQALQSLVVAARVPAVPEGNVAARLQLAVEAARRVADPERQGDMLQTLWQMPQPQDTDRLSGLGDVKAMTSMAMSPSGRWLFAVIGERLRAVELANGRVGLDVSLRGVEAAETEVPDPDPLMLATDAVAVVLYNESIYVAGRLAATVQRVPLEGVSALTISADGATAAFLLPGAAALCDLKTGCEKPELHPLTLEEPRDVALSEDGAVLVITGEQLTVFDTHPWKQRAAKAMVADGDELAVGTDAVHAYVCRTSALLEFDVYDDSLDTRPVRNFSSPAEVCGFSPNGAFSSHGDGAIRTWRLDGTLVAVVAAKTESGRKIAFGAASLVVADTEHLQLWNQAQYGLMWDGLIRSFVRSGAYAHVANPAARNDVNSEGRLLELESGRVGPAPALRLDGQYVDAVSDSMALGARIQSSRGGVDEILVFTPQSDGSERELFRHTVDAPAGPRALGSVRPGRRPRGAVAVRFSADDRYAVVLTETSSTILDVSTKVPLRTLEGKAVAIFLPDDHVLAVEGQALVAISLKDGSERRLRVPQPPTGPDQPLSRGPVAAVSSNGSRFAVAHTLGQTSVVDVYSWPELDAVTQLRHPTGVASLSFSGGGENLLVSTDDGTTHIWDVASGREVAAIPPPGADTSTSTMAVFTPSGRIAISNGASVFVLPNDPAEWRNEACRRLVRNLTPDEWAVFVGDEIPYVVTCPDRP